jgi:hypothetical protein
MCGDFVGPPKYSARGIFFLAAGGCGAFLLAVEFGGVLFVDLFQGWSGKVGDLADYFVGVKAEFDAADVADGRV